MESLFPPTTDNVWVAEGQGALGCPFGSPYRTCHYKVGLRFHSQLDVIPFVVRRPLDSPRALTQVSHSQGSYPYLLAARVDGRCSVSSVSVPGRETLSLPRHIFPDRCRRKERSPRVARADRLLEESPDPYPDLLLGRDFCVPFCQSVSGETSFISVSDGVPGGVSEKGAWGGVGLGLSGTE